MIEILQVNQQLQVLVVQINTCFRNWVLPILLLLLVLVNILSTNITVSMGSEFFTNMGYLVFPLSFLLTILTILLVGSFAGLVSKWSKSCINKFVKNWSLKILLDTKVDKRNRRWLGRKVKSCSSMKIKFGSNFMEITTPLVMLGLCAKFTIRLMLMH